MTTASSDNNTHPWESLVLEGDLSIYVDDLRGGEIFLPEIDGEDLCEILYRSLPRTTDLGPEHGRVRITVTPLKREG